MERVQIINHLIKKYNYKSYLEIGVDQGVSFEGVKCNCKIGVDPDVATKATMNVTSDFFFERNKEMFDIIFIDGLHKAEQVYIDVLNSLKFLNPNGTIVCHDMLPTSELIQRVPRESVAWTGDCWKAWVKLRSERSDLEMFVVDVDWGCGVIRRGQQKTINFVDSYDEFDKNRTTLSNIISIEQFFESFKIEDDRNVKKSETARESSKIENEDTEIEQHKLKCAYLESLPEIAHPEPKRITLESLTDSQLLIISDELKKGYFEENGITRTLAKQLFGGDSLTQILFLPSIILPVIANRMRAYSPHLEK